MSAPTEPHLVALVRAERGYRSLLAALRRSSRFGLHVVECPLPRTADALADALQGDLSGSTGPWAFERLDPYRARDDHDDALSQEEVAVAVLDPLFAPTASNLVAVDASRAVPRDDAAWSWLFDRWNERRETLRRLRPVPVVVLLPGRLVPVFADHASDVWSIRSPTAALTRAPELLCLRAARMGEAPLAQGWWRSLDLTDVVTPFARWSRGERRDPAQTAEPERLLRRATDCAEDALRAVERGDTRPARASLVEGGDALDRVASPADHLARDLVHRLALRSCELRVCALEGDHDGLLSAAETLAFDARRLFRWEALASFGHGLAVGASSGYDDLMASEPKPPWFGLARAFAFDAAWAHAVRGDTARAFETLVAGTPEGTPDGFRFNLRWLPSIARTFTVTPPSDGADAMARTLAAEDDDLEAAEVALLGSIALELASPSLLPQLAARVEARVLALRDAPLREALLHRHAHRRGAAR